ncbi:MAG: hypothetical protein FWE27_09180 [Defluviitaleaceae bacterium]|nr:hypothetical protein [Defluviitaleaceae bacterium]
MYAEEAPIENCVPSAEYSGLFFVNNRISLWTHENVSHEEAVEAITSMGGIILGYIHILRSDYTIQVPVNDEAGLRALGESFIEIFPHLFRRSDIFFGHIDPRESFAGRCSHEPAINAFGELLTEPFVRGGGDCSCPPQDLFRGINPAIAATFSGFTQRSGERLPSNDFPQWFENFLSILSAAPTNDPFWRDSDPLHQWGLRASNFPRAWLIFGRQERENVRIGIIDRPVMINHKDLNIPEENTNFPKRRDEHGSMVMSILGAQHDNFEGMAGGINIARKNLYAFSTWDSQIAVSAKKTTVTAMYLAELIMQ